MSREYADKKIKEALALCNGNVTRARQQIVMLAADDAKLLKALTKPHLDGIVSYQVERVASGRAEFEARHPEESLSAEDENFGMDLLRAIASTEVTKFGHELPASNKRKTASKQHIEAIHKIASSRKTKK